MLPHVIFSILSRGGMLINGCMFAKVSIGYITSLSGLVWFIYPRSLHLTTMTSQWARRRPNHRRPDCLLNRFRRRSKKTSKLHVTGICEGNPPVTGGFPSQKASSAKNVSISWRHHVMKTRCRGTVQAVLIWDRRLRKGAMTSHRALS